MSPRLFPNPCPALPPFRTLLVKGFYHPSAPIHLCISHTGHQTPNSKVVLLTSSRPKLVNGLVEYHDDWLTSHAGTGRVSDVSSKIDIFYPPSPTHLAFLLAMLRGAQSDNSSLHGKTTFDVIPSLLVLLEPSSYFLTDEPDHSITISSYLTLVSHALAAVAFLSESGAGGTAFALFDSQLDRLRLPILRPVTRHRTHGDDEQEQPLRKESVSFFTQKYFEWMITFEEKETASMSAVSCGERKRRLTLCRTVRTDDTAVWEWSEGSVLARDGSGKARTCFIWA